MRRIPKKIGFVLSFTLLLFTCACGRDSVEPQRAKIDVPAGYYLGAQPMDPIATLSPDLTEAQILDWQGANAIELTVLLNRPSELKTSSFEVTYDFLEDASVLKIRKHGKTLNAAGNWSQFDRTVSLAKNDTSGLVLRLGQLYYNELSKKGAGPAPTNQAVIAGYLKRTAAKDIPEVYKKLP